MASSGSGTKENGMRLLVAFHDLAGGKLNVSVPVGGPDLEEEGAADRVGKNWDATERDVALRYLIDQSCVEADESGSGYTLTYQGLEQSRDHLGQSGN